MSLQQPKRLDVATLTALLPHEPDLVSLLFRTVNIPPYLDIQLPRVLFPLLVPYVPSDDLSLLQRLRFPLAVVNQQDALPPMRFRATRSRRKRHALASLLRPIFRMRVGRHSIVSGRQEEGVEPDDPAIKRIDILLELHREVSLGECQIGSRDGVKGQLQEGRRVRGEDGRLEVLNEDLIVDVGEHAAHAEAVDGLPEGDVVGDVVRVGQGGNVEGRVGRYHEPVGDEVAVACPEDGVEHRFVEKTVPHPFRYDDVYFGDGESDVFDLAAQASGDYQQRPRAESG